MQVDEVVGKICDAGVEAVCRYVSVSGTGAPDVPELFLASFIFDRLGDEFTFTLETSARTLLRWQGVTPPESLEAPAERSEDEALTAMRGWRVDLVLYHGEQGTSKEDVPMYALVEMKKGWFSDELNTGARSDLDKLVVLMRNIDNVPYAAMAAFVPEWEHAKKEKRACERGDGWYQRPVPAEVAQDYWFCVWLLERGRGSLASGKGVALAAG